MKKTNIWTIRLLIVIVGGLLFIPFLGSVHLFDWDEINFAECAREMIRSHDYSSASINYFPFWEKPPLFIWMQVISMKVFGVNEFAARLPNALCGISTLLIIFNTGNLIYGRRFGLLWVLAFTGSLLPHFYFKSGLIDPLFNLLIFLGIYQYACYTHENGEYISKTMLNKRVLLSALFISFAILTKGPVAALVFGLCFIVYSISQKHFAITLRHLLFYCLIIAMLGGSWFLVLISKGRTDVVLEFVNYQIRLFSTEDADHGGPVYYHFIVLFIGCFPASIFAMRAFAKSNSDTPWQKHMKRWMLILFWVVLVLFSVVKTKIVHYSSLCYFPLSYLAAYTAYKWLLGEISWKKWMTICTWIAGGILAFLLIVLQFMAQFKSRIIASGLIADDFVLGNLQAGVYWSGFEFLIGVLFLFSVCLGIWFAVRNRSAESILTLFIGTLFVTSFSIIVFAPRIEGYSQHAAIEFYESLREKDCYVDVAGFKSYAHLFYADKKFQASHNALADAWLKEKKVSVRDEHTGDYIGGLYSSWLSSGNVDKPVYFVCKNIYESEFRHLHPSFSRLYARNGFVFFLRDMPVSAETGKAVTPASRQQK